MKLWEMAQKQRDEYVGSLCIALQKVTTKAGHPAPQEWVQAMVISAQKTMVRVARREAFVKDDEGRDTVTLYYEYDDLIFNTFRLPTEELDFILPKQFADDFKAMTVIPKDLPDPLKALPNTKRPPQNFN